MQTVHIAIAGGGLAGLHAAFLLEQAGVQDCVLLEARKRLGGRVLSVAPEAGRDNPANRFDLGPSWFWPDFQPQLAQLVRELGLAAFPQFETGDMLVERTAEAAPARVTGTVSAPTSMRLVGGSRALIEALHQRLHCTRILTGQTVSEIRVAGAQAELDSADAGGKTMSWRAEHVLLALPPRLAEDILAFTPPLPPELAWQWRGTATWMAPHAKYVAVYDTPFWRNAGLSGEARSAAGPLGEIHDASIPGGRAALLGFVGLPARMRKNVPEATMRALCREQFARLFGPEAAKPDQDVLQDWSLEPCTTTERDLEGILEHPFAPVAKATSGPWAGRLTGVGSEWSPQFPGYLAGAVEAAGRGVRGLVEAQDRSYGRPT